jgi:hypothetical protein
MNGAAIFRNATNPRAGRVKKPALHPGVQVCVHARRCGTRFRGSACCSAGERYGVRRVLCSLRTRRARSGRGAMATAFGAPASVLPNSPRWKALRPIAGRRCIGAVRAARPSTVCACALFAPRPDHARRSWWGERRRWCTTALLQSCAWAGCGANKAQAPAVGDSATQAAAMHSWPMKGRGIARRREFGSSAQRCAERRSHRAAARPRAALPPRTPIAPQPAHAQLCHPERPSRRSPSARSFAAPEDPKSRRR